MSLLGNTLLAIRSGFLNYAFPLPTAPIDCETNRLAHPCQRTKEVLFIHTKYLRIKAGENIPVQKAHFTIY